MDVQIGNPHYVKGLLITLVVIVVAMVAAWSRTRAASRFATSDLRPRMLPPSQSWWRTLSTSLLVLTISLVCFALMDIRWGKTTREVPQKGIEVMFALDVSRSMLAEDTAPNRLARAKQQITDMVDEMTGDRVGLVVFAGDARQSVPLTSHYDDFRQILASVGPHTLNRGGSRLGEAIRTSANGFISKTNDHKAIVIFTDGEDQESDPLEAAETAHADQGIRIFTVGLGDIDQGALVPVDRDDGTGRGGSTYLRYKGETVRSKMDGEILSKIAGVTDGAYIPAGTRRVDMASVYHRYVASVQQTEFEMATVDTYTPRFQWFALPAFLVLLAEILVSTRRQKWLRGEGNSFATSIPRAAVVWVVVAGAITPSPLRAADVDIAREINDANDLVRGGKIAEAISKYTAIESAADPVQDSLTYDLGVARFRSGELDSAKELFASAAGSDDPMIASRGRYNLGNCAYAEAITTMESDKSEAIEKLRVAIGHYRGSLASDPSLADARANIELAVKLIRELQQQEKNEDEQQQPDEPPNQDQQQGESEQQPGNQQKSEQPQQGQEPSADETQENSEQQSGEQKPAEQQPGEQQSGEQQPGEEQSSEPGESEPGEDDSAKDESVEKDDESAEPGERKDAQDSGGEEEGSPPNPSGQLTASEPNRAAQPPLPGSAEATTAGVMTREEAMKMLQSVRDRDMLRRMQLERRRQSQRYNVEKDW